MGLVVLPDVAEDGFHTLRVQAGSRLVQNEYLGFHGNDPRDGNPAFLAAGKLKGGLVPQAHKVGRRPHPAVDFFFVQPHVLGAEGDILVHRLLKELILWVLEHQPYLEPGPPGDLGVGPDVGVLEPYLSRSGLEQGVQVLDEGGFARPGVADDA